MNSANVVLCTLFYFHLAWAQTCNPFDGVETFNPGCTDEGRPYCVQVSVQPASFECRECKSSCDCSPGDFCSRALGRVGECVKFPAGGDCLPYSPSQLRDPSISDDLKCGVIIRKDTQVFVDQEGACLEGTCRACDFRKGSTSRGLPDCSSGSGMGPDRICIPPGNLKPVHSSVWEEAVYHRNPRAVWLAIVFPFVLIYIGFHVATFFIKARKGKGSRKPKPEKKKKQKEELTDFETKMGQWDNQRKATAAAKPQSESYFPTKSNDESPISAPSYSPGYDEPSGYNSETALIQPSRQTTVIPHSSRPPSEREALPLRRESQPSRVPSNRYSQAPASRRETANFTRPSQQLPAANYDQPADDSSQYVYADEEYHQPTAEESSFLSGAECLARYSGDGQWYKATILAYENEQYLVSYNGFNNEQEWLEVDKVRVGDNSMLHI